MNPNLTIELNQLSVPPGQSVLVKNITWHKFEDILEELGEHRASRLAYYKGVLEIMVPLGEHENSNRFMEQLISVLAEEMNLNIKRFGSSTLKRANMDSGAEPDSCYYIQNEPSVRSKRNIDLDSDPPPDLVVEIDITSSSLNKHEIYAALEIPEIWRYHQKKLQVFVLSQQPRSYSQRLSSPTFPNINLSTIPEFIERSLVDGEIPTLKTFRTWVRQQVA